MAFRGRDDAAVRAGGPGLLADRSVRARVDEAPVQRGRSAQRLQKYITITPAAPFSIADTPPEASEWEFVGPFAPGVTYTIHASRELRDVSGRPIVNDSVVYEMADYTPSFSYRGGLVTTQGGRSAIALRFVNVDSATMVVRAIPDAARGYWINGPDSIHLHAPLDSVVRVLALHGPFNTPRDTMLDVPMVPGHEGQLRAVTFSVRAPTQAPLPPPAGLKAGELRVSRFELARSRRPTAVLLLQSSDVMLHSKVDDHRALVFATSGRNGRPVAGAAITLYDTAGVAVGDGTTDASGVADVVARPGRRFSDVRTRHVDYYAPLRNTGFFESVKDSERAITPLVLASTPTSLSPPSLGTDWMERPFHPIRAE